MGHIPPAYNVLNRVNKLTLIKDLGCIEYTHTDSAAIMSKIIDHLSNHGNTLYSRTAILISELYMTNTQNTEEIIRCNAIKSIAFARFQLVLGQTAFEQQERGQGKYRKSSNNYHITPIKTHKPRTSCHYPTYCMK